MIREYGRTEYPRPAALPSQKTERERYEKKLCERPWYPTAVAICIGVVLYVILTRFGVVYGGVKKFLGFFAPVALGCLIAYLVTPLAKLYRRKVFAKIRDEKKRATRANLLAFVTVLVFIVLVLLVILPQLLDSIVTFANNLDGYVASLESLLDKWGLSDKLGLTSDSFEQTTKNVMDTVSAYIMNNLTKILNKTANTGKALFQLVIGFILSLYLLAEKDNLKTGLKRLMKASLKPSDYDVTVSFLRRCDEILNRYIVYNLLDSLIVGAANALFMIVTGMPYMGLVSFVVAITNLIPTFGPVIGGVIGAFVLILVKPWYAAAFLVFTVVLQICDGYVIKPRLFGNSLGVSGLWILVGVIVGGRMFGAVGMLAAIPAVAIIDFAYRERFLPWLELRRALQISEGNVHE